MYIAIVPSIPGAHTQAKTLDQLNKNIKEVVKLCLRELPAAEKRTLPKFIGISQIDVSSK